MSAPDVATETLQLLLAGEHAAVYVYGALGAQTSQSAQAALFGRLTAAYTTHRGRRDELIAMLRAADADPVPAEVAYELPALGTAAAVVAEALRVAEECTGTYAYGVARLSGDQRTWAITALLDASVRSVGFGGRPVELPGI